MIDTVASSITQEDPSMRTYKTKEVYAELGITEPQFYTYRGKGLFQVEGIRDGSNKIYSHETVQQFKQELVALREQAKEEEVPLVQEQVPEPEERVVQMITLSHKEIQPEPLHALDPIEQAILTLQKSKQQIFEQQEMIKVVRAIRERHVALLKDVDAFLERWD